MLFNSHIFLLGFFPLVMLLYYSMVGHAALRLRFLVLASFVFYGWWDWRLLPLLLASIALNWATGWLWTRRSFPLLIPLAITLNLLVLGVFKYANFFAELLMPLFGLPEPHWNILLPLGISFFTFEQIAWLVELRRGKAPLYRPDEFAFYVAFFPHLIAGPIVRHNELLPQPGLNPLREGLAERLGQGLLLLLFGLVKKVALADQLAKLADPLFTTAATIPLAADQTALAALTFGLQIYFDFSGYTDMALGLALMLGFVLPPNFNAPYRALSVQDFWRRWHMTLSRWLRDYLYIPLGGSRHGAVRQGAALMLTMLLGGLWHGAGLTFLLWGALHGTALAVHRLWQITKFRVPSLMARAMTFSFVMLAWLPFRAPDGTSLANMARGLGQWSGAAKTEHLALVAFGLLVVWAFPSSASMAEKRWISHPALAPVAALASFALLMLIGSAKNVTFIYFQF